MKIPLYRNVCLRFIFIFGNCKFSFTVCPLHHPPAGDKIQGFILTNTILKYIGRKILLTLKSISVYSNSRLLRILHFLSISFFLPALGNLQEKEGECKLELLIFAKWFSSHMVTNWIPKAWSIIRQILKKWKFHGSQTSAFNITTHGKP